MYLLTSSILFPNNSNYKCQFCTKVRLPLKMVQQVYGCEKYRDKGPDVSGSDKNIKTPCNTKLKLTELNDLYFKSTEKLAKMNVCNSKTLTFQSKRYTFRSFLKVFTVYTEVYYPRFYKVANWCKSPSKSSIIISVSFYP